MLRVVLVDDERLAREGIRGLLAAHPQVEVVGEAARVSKAVEVIEQERPHAIFLDIQMPGANGFELLGQLENAPKVVFVTAYSAHAARAFEVQAVDYLLKPVRPERLADAVRRLEAVCTQHDDAVSYTRNDRICLRTPERTLIATFDAIIALEAEGDFTRFYVAGETPLLVYRSLGSYEKILPQQPFARLSRSLMVNLERVTSAKHLSRDETSLVMRDLPKPFTIGRRALARLKTFTR